MENETTTQNCRNCGHPLPEGAKYCPQCSQKNHDGRLRFREMAVEMVSTIFNLDNKIFRSFLALLVPGKLTVDYFEGKHVRYYHPLRLFLFTGVALISIATVRYQQGRPYQQMEEVAENMKMERFESRFNARLDSVRLAYRKELTDPSALQALDTFCYRSNVLRDSAREDSSTFNLRIIDENQKSVTIATKDLMELPTDSLLNRYQVEGFWERMVVARAMRMMKGTNQFLISMLGNAIWMMLVMMPLLALFLKMLYRRKPYYYYEHLVFSLHVHAAAFGLFFLLLSLGKYQTPWLNAIAMIIAFLYPFFAMWRVYQQGFFKTLLKYFLLCIAYFLLGMVSFIVLAMVSFVLF